MSKSVSTDFYDVTTRPAMVKRDFTGFHRDFTLLANHLGTPRAQGVTRGANFLASTLFRQFHPVFTFIAVSKVHFEV